MCDKHSMRAVVDEDEVSAEQMNTIASDLYLFRMELTELLKYCDEIEHMADVLLCESNALSKYAPGKQQSLNNAAFFREKFKTAYNKRAERL